MSPAKVSMNPDTFVEEPIEVQPHIEADLLSPIHSDVGNAERFVELFGRNVRYCPRIKKWLVWDNKRWKEDDLEHVVKLAKKSMLEFFHQAIREGDRDSEKYAKSSLNAVKIRGLIDMVKPEVAIEVESLDTHDWLLNCSNGTIYLKTGKLKPHRREDFITKITPLDYIPGARCQPFHDFLKQIIPSQDLRDYLQKVFGYALTGDVSEKAIFCCFGDGNNGKTTLLNTIGHVMGDYASQVLIDSLMSKSFGSDGKDDLADLRGARFGTTSEGEEGQRLAEAKVKVLTAGMGKVKTRRLYERHIEFKATHKLFMDSNHKPVVRGTDSAIWNRLKAIPFNVTITKIDKKMAQKLQGRTVAEGILAYLVRGCLLWQKEGLGDPPAVTATSAAWRGEMDPLKGFIGTVCELKEGAKCKSSDLWDAYDKWAEDHEKLNRKQFSDRLKQLGCISDRTTRSRFWLGIELIES